MGEIQQRYKTDNSPFRKRDVEISRNNISSLDNSTYGKGSLSLLKMSTKSFSVHRIGIL